MINITKVKGQPGAWINPKDNKASEKYTLLKDLFAYFTSMDSKNREDAVKKYGAGEYLVYKVANGMINVTKDMAAPGAWINPNDNVVYKPCPGDIYLTANSAVYMNAENAIRGKDAVKMYGAGEYFIYKSVPGAINITKVKGQPGAWIKVSDLISECPLPTTTTPGTTKPGTTKPETTKPGTTKPGTTKPETTKPGTTKPGTTTSTTTSAEAKAYYFNTLEEALAAFPVSFPMYENGKYVVYSKTAPVPATTSTTSTTTTSTTTTTAAEAKAYYFNTLEEALAAFPNSFPMYEKGKYVVYSKTAPVPATTSTTTSTTVAEPTVTTVAAPKTSFENVPHYFATPAEAMDAYPNSRPLAENGYFVVYTDKAGLTKYEFATLKEAIEAFPDSEPMADNGKFYVWTTQFPVEKYTFNTVREFKNMFPDKAPMAEGSKFVIWTNERPLIEYSFASYADAINAFPGSKPMADGGKFTVWSTYVLAPQKPVITPAVAKGEMVSVKTTAEKKANPDAGSTTPAMAAMKANSVTTVPVTTSAATTAPDTTAPATTVPATTVAPVTEAPTTVLTTEAPASEETTAAEITTEEEVTTEKEIVTQAPYEIEFTEGGAAPATTEPEVTTPEVTE